VKSFEPHRDVASSRAATKGDSYEVENSIFEIPGDTPSMSNNFRAISIYSVRNAIHCGDPIDPLAAKFFELRKKVCVEGKPCWYKYFDFISQPNGLVFQSNQVSQNFK